MLKSAMLITFVMFAAAACNNTSMSGNSGKRESADQEKIEPKPKKKATNEDDAKGDVDTDIDTGVSDTLPPTTLPDFGSGTDAAVPQPDEIVDGTEVVNDCGRCVERAKVLSAQSGFVADIAKTYNLGFYKIDPSRNLCDIHFMANMSSEIANHEGQDSTFPDQVVMYCPCNCNWASTGPSFDGPVPFTP